MPLYVLMLGSSFGLKDNYLNLAKEKIKNNKNIILLEDSKIYKTFGFNTERNLIFLNMAMLIKTNLYPLSLLYEINNIEFLLGRLRPYKNSPRTIDIDIFLADFCYNNKKLQIPHKDGFSRDFFKIPTKNLKDVNGKISFYRRYFR